jgi:hypothetical protein
VSGPGGGNRGRSRWLIRIAILVVAGIAFAVWAVQRESPGLTVENRSGQAIAVLHVKVGGETSTFQDVPAGRELKVPLANGGDTPFEVDGQLADGTRLRGRFGAGAAPGKPRATLVILPGGQINVKS